MLEAMGTPEDVLGLSVIYLRIYFAGIIANLVYNVGAAILRAVGDSKRPLYFLAASCLVNIALDILLVVFCRLGVVGAALATILSQLFSAFLVVACLMQTKDMHRLVLKELCLDGRMLKRIIRIGLPAGMQSVMYGLSNVIIQSGINSLGTNTVAAWAAYSKLDSVFWMMINALWYFRDYLCGTELRSGEDGPRASRRADLHGYDDSGISWHVVSHLPLWSLWV